MLLFYVFFYLVSAVLVLQGHHLAAEVSDPLGTVPEEVAQAPTPSLGWGSFLMAYGTLCIIVALLSHAYAYFGSALLPLRNTGFVIMAVFGAWVIFKGRTVKYLGVASTGSGHAAHAENGHH